MKLIQAIKADTSRLLELLPTAIRVPDRIAVDPTKPGVTVDGQRIGLTDDQAQVIRVLHKHAPGWVDRTQWKKEQCHVGNVPRLINRLPTGIKKFCEKRRGLGCRLIVR